MAMERLTAKRLEKTIRKTIYRKTGAATLPHYPVTPVPESVGKPIGKLGQPHYPVTPLPRYPGTRKCRKTIYRKTGAATIPHITPLPRYPGTPRYPKV